ncbi:hypothetical protein [Demequina sp.]|uniref:uridine kinase family protein n=1 Tax=Demequina sp. TaxID=2050685 RepID=UPI0025EE3162|nr:hypothetical protein [Demequina sp.]
MPNPGVKQLATALRVAIPRLGGTRLLLVDGPAGSGKTTLADAIAGALGVDSRAECPVQVLHGDDMYEGWSGLATLDGVLIDGVLDPLSRGESGTFRRWDWHLGRRAEKIVVPPRPFLVVEGVGVASRRARAHASMLIYVDAPWETRIARGIARDGEAMREEWERWQVSEAAHLEAAGTRDAADVVLDGTAPVPA